MSIIILGTTPCGICGKPLSKGDAVTSFGPFVANEADPLHCFSDAAFHKACFDIHRLAAEASARFQSLRARTAPGSRKCAVCGQEVRDPDDYLPFGFIAAAPDAIRSLNYLQFHRKHLAEWPGLTAAHLALVTLSESGLWKGPALKWLIAQLAKALKEKEQEPRE